MIKRESYMRRIRPFIGGELIKVMPGIRRCGKSVMLELVKQELLDSGVGAEQFITLNFEDLRNAPLCRAEALHAEILRRAAAIPGKAYLFFDEIQEVQEWEKCVNSLRVALDCDIYMGEVDIAKQHPNVVRMQMLGARVIPVSHGLKTLKEAVDAAFEGYMREYHDAIYCIGSALGPHPFPLMVRDFQSVVGYEAKEQFLEMTGLLPDVVCAAVGGGSNAIGMFEAFLPEPVEIVGVEPLGRGEKVGDHAASMKYGSKGILHGFESILLQDESGAPLPVYSIASGLDYPGVGPEHAYLRECGRVNYDVVSDEEAMEAFFLLCRTEGIIPAIESSHAVAYAIRYAKEHKNGSILVNLSGRGDKDIDYVYEKYGTGEQFTGVLN